MERIILTLLVAGLGGFIGIKLKIPAGALIGAMISVAIYNIYTDKGSIPVNFRIAAQIVVGGMIGLKFTKQSVYELKNLFVPAIILVVGLTVFSVILGLIVHKTTGLDIKTALFSTSPGGLTDMSLIADAYGADITKVVVLHLMRLITVITVLPIVIKVLIERVLK